jgi:RND family efflux transporter MFP subunit
MKKGLLFRTLRLLLVLLSALFIAGLLIAFKPEAQREPPRATDRLVEVFPAAAETVEMVVDAFGSVRPRETLDLVAEVHGQIVYTAPAFEEGAFVEADRELVRIDPRPYALEVDRRRVAIEQSEAELKRLQQEIQNLRATIAIAASDLELAKFDLGRLETLVGREVVAQSTVDKARQRYLASLERLQNFENQLALTGPRRDQLKAQRDMTVVQLRQAELDLENTAVAAPFDGWVLEKAVEKGQYVTGGQYLGRIYSDGALEIEVRIPLKDVKWIPFDPGSGSFPPAEILLENSGENFLWRGRVVRLKAQMDQSTRTLPMIVDVEPGGTDEGGPERMLLRPGIFVRVQITGKVLERAFALPRHVVYPGDVVYTVRDGRLQIKSIRVLRRYKETVIADQGLEDGDLIVKTPLSAAIDGMKVRLNQASDSK